jgi:hypothetical protein
MSSPDYSAHCHSRASGHATQHQARRYLAAHAAYIGFVVNKRGVAEAAGTYARQLILSCETFLGKEKPAPTKRKSARQSPSAAEA